METRKRFFRIKENVWFLEEDGNGFSVKRYAEAHDAEKIRTIHEQLQEAQYPFTVPVTEKGNAHIVVQPWLANAHPVDFTKQSDRRASLAALEALHATESVVDWKALPHLRRYTLLDKWGWRLERFRITRPIIETYLQTDAIDEIERLSEQGLDRLQSATERDIPHTLLHGDVVHHNLLKTPDGTVYLIDFDLACIGHPDVEIGLWLHRVLPNIEYDARTLFDEEPRLQVLGQQPIAMLQYPNELLREWTYLANLPAEQQQILVKHLLPFTEQALDSWSDICRFSNSLLEDDRYFP